MVFGAAEGGSFSRVQIRGVPLYRITSYFLSLAGHIGAGDRAAGTSSGPATSPQASGRHHPPHSRVPGEEGGTSEGVPKSIVSYTSTAVFVHCTVDPFNLDPFNLNLDPFN